MPKIPINAELPANVEVLGYQNNYVDILMSRLCNASTGAQLFRTTLAQLGATLAMAALKFMPSSPMVMADAMNATFGGAVTRESIGLIPILTAGDHLKPGVQMLLPDASHHPITIQRDEATKLPVVGAHKLVGIPVDWGMVLEPMIASGGSLNAAISMIKKWGVSKITVLSCLAAPEGIHAVHAAHPEVNIVVGDLGKGLNSNLFIIGPAAGDCGDRANGLRL
jgi:uracil phosphoribosyltransferase